MFFCVVAIFLLGILAILFVMNAFNMKDKIDELEAKLKESIDNLLTRMENKKEK